MRAHNIHDSAQETPSPDIQETATAQPAKLPRPTYWPFFMALGLAFAGWGLLTTCLVSAGGLLVLIVSLTGWINNLRHE